MKAALKRLYFNLREVLLLNKLAHVVPGMIKPFILCYHQIDSKEFDQQLAVLKKRFEVVDLKTFASRIEQKKTGGYCTLTLDDCLVEDVEKATEICRKHNLPLTLFLPVRFSVNNQALPGTWVQKLLEKRKAFILNGLHYQITPENKLEVKHKVNTYFNPAKFRIVEFEKVVQNFFEENNIPVEEIITDGVKVMPVDAVRELSMEKAFCFQSHTYNHESLSLCTPAEIEDEFSSSKKALEEITQKEVFAICYPYGSKEIIGDKIFAFVSTYYSCGLSLEQGVCTETTNPFFMPRIGIYPGDGLKFFLGKIYHYMQTNWLK
ncbi:MAG: polysaccharide deacetylase family protein [Saprospiraceae bacterium]